MATIEGIIYNTFENRALLRGYAPIRELASISYKNPSYQRDTDKKHLKDIINFLDRGLYKFFPEVILALRVEEYEAFLKDISYKEDIDPHASDHVDGLFIKSDYIPIKGNRARHSNYKTDKKKLLRVDGNHRLEIFDKENNDLWSGFDKTKTEEIGKLIVPYCIVFSSEEIGNQFETAIFNNINFKQLPLKREKNLENIYNHLKDSDELNEIEKLAMILIEKCENLLFRGLPFLIPTKTEDEYYRTTCYKISYLLHNMIDNPIESEYQKRTKEKIDLLKKNIITEERELSNIKGEIRALKKEESNEIEIQEKRKLRDDLINKIATLNERKEKLDYYLSISEERINTYLSIYNDPNKIELAIQSLREVYDIINKNNHGYGNISLMAALVYYTLSNKAKRLSFVSWIVKNSLNKINPNEFLPTHNAKSLIDLFELVYAKEKREIFISMQFGDPQSEMIYEKIIQTINKFNKVHTFDIDITTIRVDQNTKPHLTSISDEILRAINNSSLIIADVSSANINVYHEIGYAMGIAEERKIEPHVILLYKEDTDFNKEPNKKDVDKFIGFNLRGFSQVRFRTYKELNDSLTTRLEKHFDI